MELIKLTNDTAILDGSTASKIADFERQVKELKTKEDELKKAILKEMQDKSIIKLDTEKLTITYVAPYDKETLESKVLKEELPDIYDTYIKISPVKPSIRIKLKG